MPIGAMNWCISVFSATVYCYPQPPPLYAGYWKLHVSQGTGVKLAPEVQEADFILNSGTNTIRTIYGQAWKTQKNTKDNFHGVLFSSEMYILKLYSQKLYEILLYWYTSAIHESSHLYLCIMSKMQAFSSIRCSKFHLPVSQKRTPATRTSSATKHVDCETTGDLEQYRDLFCKAIARSLPMFPDGKTCMLRRPSCMFNQNWCLYFLCMAFLEGVIWNENRASNSNHP